MLAAPKEHLMTTREPHRLWLVAAPALALGLVLAGCSATAEPVATSTASTSETAETTSDLTGATDANMTAADVLAANQEPHDKSDDAEYDASDATTIALSGSSATISGRSTSTTA